jgi:amidase
MDVVVPFARTMADLLEVLDVVVAADPDTRGDLWRLQPWVPIPAVDSVRPASYATLAASPQTLAGKRFGVPRMYINADLDAGTAEAPGIGGPTGQRIITRTSVIDLWEQARQALQAQGAEVIEVDFPLVSNCEGDRPGAPTVYNRGIVSKEFLHHELWDLTAWAFDDFLQANGDPKLNRLADVNGPLIFPHDPGTLPNREGDLAAGMDEYVNMAQRGITPWDQIETLADGLRGLEHTRRIDLEDWMQALGLDAVLFPTVADVAPADADVNPVSADIAWSNGIWVANGNLAIRHLGVPTVTVPMGVMADIGMPVGLTFAGRAYDDSALLSFASAFEAIGSQRMIPPRTPPLSSAPGRA